MSNSSNGTLKQEGVITQKGARREEMIDRILEALSDEQIYETMYYQRKKESEVKDRLFTVLIDCLKGLHKDLGGITKAKTIEERARNSVLWEGNPQTTVNNIQFMGVQHRPDFVVQFDGLETAVEIKLGDKGAAIREGLGQSLVYAADFDFVAYLFIDSSQDKKVLEGYKGGTERSIVDSLWSNYNIKFKVV